jgi:hypothetical protein
VADQFTCPRRVAEGRARTDSPFRGDGPGVDEWTKRAGLVGQPLGCSYCGSLPADMFMEQVRSGAETGPTDKSYKLYLEVPSPGAGTLRVLSSSNSSNGGLRPYKELTRREKKAVKEHAGPRDTKRDYKNHFWGLTTWGQTTEAKFYTHHLTEDQGWEFHRLWLEGKINWGYPGAPYVRLFIPGPSTADRNDPRLNRGGDDG